MLYPTDLKYSKSHEWVKMEDGVAVIGISDFAQDALGDVVFVEVPETGKTLSAKDSFAVVESVKAASDVYAPLDGTITAVNDDLPDAPERVNETPFGDGWLFRIKPDDPAAFGKLMSAADYDQSIGA